MGQSLQTASDGYSTYAREATAFLSGIFGWISCYYDARDYDDLTAQSLF
jgi:hypothetical protein